MWLEWVNGYPLDDYDYLSTCGANNLSSNEVLAQGIQSVLECQWLVTKLANEVDDHQPKSVPRGTCTTERQVRVIQAFMATLLSINKKTCWIVNRISEQLMRSQICLLILLVCPKSDSDEWIAFSRAVGETYRRINRTGSKAFYWVSQTLHLSTLSMDWNKCSCEALQLYYLICGFCCVPTSTACNLFLRPEALPSCGVWCVPLEVSWVVGPVVFSGTGGGSSRGGGSHLGPRSRRTTMKSGFHSVELNKTVWEVPERWAVIRKLLEMHLASQTIYRRRTNKYVRNKGRFDDISFMGFSNSCDIAVTHCLSKVHPVWRNLLHHL